MLAQETVVVELVGRIRGRALPAVEQEFGASFDVRLEMVTDLAGHGEWGVAFEDLCSNVHDFGIPLSNADYEAFADAGSSLGVTSTRWTFLRELVVD